MNDHAYHVNGVKYTTYGSICKYIEAKALGPIMYGDLYVADGMRASHIYQDGEFIELEPQLVLRKEHKYYLDQFNCDEYWENFKLDPIPTRLIRESMTGEYRFVHIVSCAANLTKYYCCPLGKNIGHWLAVYEFEFVTDLATVPDEFLTSLMENVLSD